MKKIGFLSFGHWTPAPYSEVRTASDALLQSIELAVAAEELGRVLPRASLRTQQEEVLKAWTRELEAARYAARRAQKQ